jgi:ribosome-associated translation inhibitor RaiA
VFVRLLIEENAARTLHRVSLTCEAPGRTLAAREERHDAEDAVREAFAEIERQLERQREMLNRRAERRCGARRARPSPTCPGVTAGNIVPRLERSASGFKVSRR